MAAENSLSRRQGSDSTARINQTIKVYLIPDERHADAIHGVMTAFFDDHDEPIVLYTPPFDGDDLATDLFRVLEQEQFDLYFFDEHDRELLGVRAGLTDVEGFRTHWSSGSLAPINLSEVFDKLAAMQDWFGRRTASDDAAAFTIKFNEAL